MMVDHFPDHFLLRKWLPIAYLSRYMNDAQDQFSVNLITNIFLQKGVPTQQRLAVLLGTKIFDRVRKEKEEASALSWSMMMNTIGSGKGKQHSGIMGK